MRTSFQEVKDHLMCMYQQETNSYQCCIDYMDATMFKSCYHNHSKVYDKWRRSICKWSYDIADHFGFDREIVLYSLNYLDRYIAKRLEQFNERKQKNIHGREFQLAGMTTLYIALKIHGQNEAENCYENNRLNEGKSKSYSRKKINKKRICGLSSRDFSRLSRGVYKDVDFVKMEMNILLTLNWRVNPPTPVKFLINFLQVIDSDLNYKYPQKNVRHLYQERKQIKFVLYELARYFLELAVSVYDLSVRLRPSCIALTSLVMAMDAMDDEWLPQALRQEFDKGLSKVVTREHERDLHHVKFLIQDVCDEALSSSRQISSHIHNLLGKKAHKIYLGDKFNVSPTSVMKKNLYKGI